MLWLSRVSPRATWVTMGLWLLLMPCTASLIAAQPFVWHTIGDGLHKRVDGLLQFSDRQIGKGCIWGIVVIVLSSVSLGLILFLQAYAAWTELSTLCELCVITRTLVSRYSCVVLTEQHLLSRQRGTL